MELPVDQAIVVEGRCCSVATDASDGGGRAPKPRNEVPRMRVGEGGEGGRKV